MGYYTRHSLAIISGGDTNIDYEKEISELADDGNCFNGESIKWYECDENMLEYSKRYPNVLFCIHGEGEETGDLWNAYYKNGKMQRCNAIIKYEPYDENKME